MVKSPATPGSEAVLIARVRAALKDVPSVTEKKMFGSTAFLVGGKFAIAARTDRLMCRIDPEEHAELARTEGCRGVVMKGRPMRGYVYVDAASVASAPALRRWIKRVLTQNRRVISR